MHPWRVGRVLGIEMMTVLDLRKYPDRSTSLLYPSCQPPSRSCDPLEFEPSETAGCKINPRGGAA